MRTSTLSIVLCVLAALATTLTVLAGPPLLCHEIPIGSAKSIQCGKDAHGRSASYDKARLVKDTLSVLDDSAPVLVRMETIRRATLAMSRETQVADELLGSLLSRIADAEASGSTSALAWFDAGYLAACMNQAGVKPTFGPKTSGRGAKSIPGYSWVVKAMDISPDDTSMQLAAALITVDHRVPEHRAHVKSVLESGKLDAASEDLLKWIAQINGTTIDALRSQLGVADARSSR